jgi:hypothetical protein
MDNNFILATHITGVYDVNRNTVLKDDDYAIVKAWADSVTALKLKGVIFHNNFSEATCKANENEYIQFVKVLYDATFNPNVFRYSIYNKFLQENILSIDNVFFTDISDVVLLQNPFSSKLYLENPQAIFCGDEQEVLDNIWMHAHGEYLRNKMEDYAAYEKMYKKETLLNCGIMGGGMKIMQPFMAQLWAIHEKFNSNNTTAYTGDMGAFNYLVRTKYNALVIHGKPVNTVFKKYEYDVDCWFKHK